MHHNIILNRFFASVVAIFFPVRIQVDAHCTLAKQCLGGASTAASGR
jgi:hypothetical protein